MRTHFYLIVLFFFISAGLSAQSFRLLADGGTILSAESHNKNGATGHFGLEMLVPVAPRTYLSLEVGAGYRSHLLLDPTPGADTEPFINGIRLTRFAEFATYQVRSQNILTGVGIEQHINRFRAQLSGRIGYRFAEEIRFREETIFSGSRPMNVFDVEVASGEQFQQDVQTGQIDLNKRWRFQLGTSIRYGLTKRLEIGLATYYDLGNYRIDRRIVSFCNTCPTTNINSLERSVKNRGIELLLSTRYQL